MRIKKITWQSRNDFNADIECEHCGHVQHLKYGYHDANYHDNVMPAITCKKCGKNRAGDADNPNPDGIVHVSAVQS